MNSLLISWIGTTDLKAMSGEEQAGIGPIAQAVSADSFSSIILLSDYPEDRVVSFIEWLQPFTESAISYKLFELSSPTNYEDIFYAASKTLEAVTTEHDNTATITIHLSPGTPAMAAVWVLLAKTKHPARLIESSKQYGVKEAIIPFDISVDFIPGLISAKDNTIERIAAGLPDTESVFEDIVHRSGVMKRVILKARQAAIHSVPILLEGESGTGKELFARAIHKASPRKDQPFITINCGAIPTELIESELFGYEKGSFSGATERRIGHFEAADRGTIFLDEIGELPLDMQVRLLRVLQEGEIKRIGATAPRNVDVRAIAATNRTLIEEVGKGAFREDLFYRLAVAVIKLPPLRERTGDVSLLIDHFMKQICSKDNAALGGSLKKLSAKGRNILLNHTWPGNVRELLNTITRAIVWSTEASLSERDIRESMLLAPQSKKHQDNVLDYQLSEGFKLDSVIDEIKVHYIKKALEETHGNKRNAAKLLGLPTTRL